MPAVWLVYFAVNDVPGTVEDALALGGKIFVQPRQTDTSVVAGILDEWRTVHDRERHQAKRFPVWRGSLR